MTRAPIVIALLALAAVAIALPAIGLVRRAAARGDERTLTISVYGFSQDAFDAILYKPFEAQCGCRIVVEVGNSGERLAKLEANRDRSVVDLAVLSSSDALDAARNGLLARIDTGRLVNFGDLYDIAKDPNGDGTALGYTIYATSIVYRADKVTINSWSDLLAGKLASYVALPNIYTNQGPQTLAMIGLAMGDYRVDLRKPIEAVGADKDAITTFYVRTSQLAQLFEQQEIWAAPVGRFAWINLRKSRFPLRWATPREGQAGGMNAMVLLKGSRHADLAYRFMDFWLSTKVQTALAEHLVDSPANKLVRVSPKIAENLTYGPDMLRQLRFQNSATILSHRDQWLREYNRAVGQ